MHLTVEDKDWNRMYDLIVDGKDGAGVARSIKSKEKAVARYVAAMRLLSRNPADYYEDDTYNKYFKGDFADFANKALDLGATYDDIYSVWDNCPAPVDLIEKIKGYFGAVDVRANIPDNFFKELRHRNIPIMTRLTPGKSIIDIVGVKEVPMDIVFYPGEFAECSVSIKVSVHKNGEANEYALVKTDGLKVNDFSHCGYNFFREQIFNALDNREEPESYF